MKLSGWANYPVADCRLASFASAQEAARLVAGHTITPRGNGRSYGDAALGNGVVLSTARYKRILAFDESAGTVSCQAGVLVSELLERIVPRGWFLPVVPGTRFVTIGGMVAADVHGKNHHADGSFSAYLTELVVMDGEGGAVHCSPQRDAELFWATCGGMGLTGLILSASFRLMPIATAQMRQRRIRCENLHTVLETLSANLQARYAVAWLDGFAAGRTAGRGVVFLGDHAAAAQGQKNPLELPRRKRVRLPGSLPGLLNRYTACCFNSLYYRRHATAGWGLVDHETFFFPLDHVLQWNRWYGRRGFLQLHLLLPLDATAGLAEILELARQARREPYLAVLKRMGEGGPGLLSFPTKGYSLALDFPLNGGSRALLQRLYERIAHQGGRVYLAKDALADPALLRSTYPHVARFRRLREQRALVGRFESMLSRRLEL